VDRPNLLRTRLAPGTQRFQSSGSGEPLLHPDLLDLARRCLRAKRFFTVNTDGTRLDLDPADALFEMGFDELRVTTFAGTPETYERTHPGSSGSALDRIRESLCLLAERKRAAAVSVPRVWIVCVVLRENAGDVGELARSGIDHNFSSFLRVCRKRLDTRALYERIPGSFVWVSARVDVSGEVCPCCRCYRSMGNVHERSFREIWFDAEYRRLRERAARLHRREDRIPGWECGSCPQHTANFKLYRALHPVKGRSRRIPDLRPEAPEAGP
jgi:MoaA/NifB/PqqE/SkfB family radical SAM enzyme